MDDATATKAQDIVVKGINENEEGIDAAEQVHRFLQQNKIMLISQLYCDNICDRIYQDL